MGFSDSRAQAKDKIPAVHARSNGWAGGAAVAAFGWLVQQRSPFPAPRPVDWGRAETIALLVARRQALSSPDHLANVLPLYREHVRRSQQEISDYLDLRIPRIDSVLVLGRDEWASTNIAAFKETFAAASEASDRLLGQASLGTIVLGYLVQTALTAEMGALVGFLSNRVLGQYDPALLGKEPVRDGRIYFVEQNIASVQAGLDVPPDDFRMWIALHETTHAFQFGAFPWVRDHINMLLRRYVEAMTGDLTQTDTRARLAQMLVANWRKPARAHVGLLGLMNRQQGVLFQELQALMSLVEGYSNHVMVEMASRLIPGHAMIKERLAQRTIQKSMPERMFARLTGLGMKMEQYRTGESFVDHVVRQRGIAFMNTAWTEPAMLPTLDEIRAPQRWVNRIAKLG